MAKIEIDLLDTSLENSGDGDEMLGMVDEGSFGSGGDDKSQLATQGFLDSGEDDGSYNYRDPSVGTVTYRLVHVAGNDEGGGVAGSGPSAAMFHTGAASDVPPVQTVLANPINGQFYVIGNPNEVFGTTGNKTIMPRETHSRVANVVKKRDDRRRATHNEVERRRRDKINNWIVRLSKIIPPSQEAGDKAGLEVQSKGGILAKACEYIAELKESHNRLVETIREKEQMALEITKMNHELSSLKRTNAALRTQLAQNGLAPHNDGSGGS